MLIENPSAWAVVPSTINIHQSKSRVTLVFKHEIKHKQHCDKEKNGQRQNKRPVGSGRLRKRSFGRLRRWRGSDLRDRRRGRHWECWRHRRRGKRRQGSHRKRGCRWETWRSLFLRARGPRWRLHRNDPGVRAGAACGFRLAGRNFASRATECISSAAGRRSNGWFHRMLFERRSRKRGNREDRRCWRNIRGRLWRDERILGRRRKQRGIVRNR